MALADVARVFYALLTVLAQRADAGAREVWQGLDPAALGTSWAASQAQDRLLAAVSSLQLAAAQQAEAYVRQAVLQQDAAPNPLGSLFPQRLAGVASDGRDLDTLLLQPLISTTAAVVGGADPASAVKAGENALATIVATQVSDAGRAAVDVAMTTDAAVQGHVRMLVPPSCGRCAVLAGRFYRWSSGFERHPECDCVPIPAVENATEDLRTDPEAYFQSLSHADQNRYFTKAGAEAIRQGADIGQVVNARRGARGLSRPGRLTAAEQQMLRNGKSRGRLEKVDVYGRQLEVTVEGTTRRGAAGSRLIAQSGTARSTSSRYRRAKTPRLMPEGIAEIANGDRAENVRLLRRFGYIL